MAGIFRTAKDNSYKPNYTGVQVQTSANTLPVPLCYGTVQVASNMIWYGDFVATNVKQAGAKGGLFSSPSTGKNYSAAVILAICEGAISGFGNVWVSQAQTTLAGVGLSFMSGAQGQAAWSFVADNYPSQALPYNATAYVYSPSFSLGSSATLDQINYEVYALLSGTGFNQIDADPAQVVYDFLTHPLHGVGFPAASIDVDTLFGGDADGSYQSYCKAVGFAISPALSSLETADAILSRWLQITNTAPVWSGGLLKFIPYGDTPILRGNIVTLKEVRQTPKAGEIASSYNAQTRAVTGYQTPVVTVRVSFWVQFVFDGGVVYTFNQSPLIKIAYVNGKVPGRGQYMVNAGEYYFSAADSGFDVTITYNYSVAASYYPNVTPIVALNEDDFLDDGQTDPVVIVRSDPYKAYNVQRVEITQRDAAYSKQPVEARDQDAIELYGLRVDSGVSANEICDQQMGQMTAQLLLQRGLYIRNSYKFKVSWEFAYLDPMDIVSLTTDTRLNGQLARIVSIDEDDKGLLSVVAEEFFVGIGTATPYLTHGSSGNLINRQASSPAINPPIIFKAPTTLTLTSTAQYWAVVSGPPASGSVGWGGCYVWASVDNSNYSVIGTLSAGAVEGVLTAPLPYYGGANPDVDDAISVNTAISGETFATSSNISAQLLNTLSVIDGELLSYATSTLTGTDQQNLTYLYRGAYATTVTPHCEGALIGYLGSGVFKWTPPSTYGTQTVWLKFQSFNSLGGGVQALDDCIAFAFNPTTGIDHPVALMMMAGGPIDLGSTVTKYLSDDFGGVTGAAAYTIDLGAIGDDVLHPAAALLIAGSSLDFGNVTESVGIIDDWGSLAESIASYRNLGALS